MSPPGIIPFDEKRLVWARKEFMKMKTYKDGTIHNSEFLDFLNIVGVPTLPDQVEKYNRYFKTYRGDDRTPMEEQMHILSVVHDNKKFAMALAKLFDKDGDGIISQEEFEIGMKCIVAYDPVAFAEKGKTSFADFIAQADTNKDGQIQIEELEAWLSSD